SSRRRRCAPPVWRPTRACAAAVPTRTSSTSPAYPAPSLPTAWRRSTHPTSTSPSPTSSGWSTSRSGWWRPRVPLSPRWGPVTAITERLDELIRCEVDGTACIAYPHLTGPVEEGDTVLVNTQARDLGLGSGGFDVLYANLTRGLSLDPAAGAHVMSLPYAPGQAAFATGEEGAELPESLEGLPALCGGLHS